MNNPFHLAIPVDDLNAAHAFYHGVLGCPLGRQSDHWIDFDFFGHQLVTHLAPDDVAAMRDQRGAVDGDAVPVRHFGCVLDWPIWESLAERLKSSNVEFVLDPKVRFKDKPGEQGTFFVRDPAGNALEFKSFRNMDQLFAT